MPLGFQVQLNDDIRIRAGDDAISVLTAMVTYVASRQEIELRVGGLFARQSSGNEHVDWLHRKLRVGDRIVLTVTDSSEFRSAGAPRTGGSRTRGADAAQILRAIEGPIALLRDAATRARPQKRTEYCSFAETLLSCTTNRRWVSPSSRNHP